MVVNTGQIYRGQQAIAEAEARGEPVVEVSERVAQAVEIGMAVLNRHERRKQAKLARQAKKQQKGRKRHE